MHAQWATREHIIAVFYIQTDIIDCSECGEIIHDMEANG